MIVVEQWTCGNEARKEEKAAKKWKPERKLMAWIDWFDCGNEKKSEFRNECNEFMRMNGNWLAERMNGLAASIN